MICQNGLHDKTGPGLCVPCRQENRRRLARSVVARGAQAQRQLAWIARKRATDPDWVQRERERCRTKKHRPEYQLACALSVSVPVARDILAVSPIRGTRL